MLEHQLEGQNAEKFRVEKDHLRFQLAASGSNKEIGIELYLSPVCKSRTHLLDSIRATQPAERFYFYPSLVKERNEFVGRQPPHTKTLIRLMTWWASKQRWRTSFSAPSDWLIELIVIHACQQLAENAGGEELELAATMTSIIEVFANFESIKVLWADSGTAIYQLQDIWRPLLSHEPLFMDPLNPFCNLVDVNKFDAHELASNAQSAVALLCFKREAAQFMAPAAAADEDTGSD